MKCPVCKEEVKRIPSHFKKMQDEKHIAYYNEQCKIGKTLLFKNIVISKIRECDEIKLKQ